MGKLFFLFLGDIIDRMDIKFWSDGGGCDALIETYAPIILKCYVYEDVDQLSSVIVTVIYEQPLKTDNQMLNFQIEISNPNIFSVSDCYFITPMYLGQ